MSALGEAIAQRRPAGLAKTSPLHGLRRGSVRTVDLVAQSVAAVAPAGVLLTQTGGLSGRLGSFSFLALLLTSAVVVLVALSMSVFARRIAAAGGIYTFVTRGLGPLVGVVAGAAIGIGYASVAVDTLRSGVRRIARLIAPSAQDAAGTAPDLALTALLVVACIALIVTVITCGARTSTRIMLVIEAVAVAAILGVSATVFVATGANLAPLIPDPSAMPSISAFAGGIGLALVSFVGFESGAALGPESRRPLASVPRALVWTAVGIAVVYLFGTAAQLSAASSGAVGRTSTLSMDVAVLDAAPWISTAVDAVIAASWIACTLACTNALVRLVFTMAREGVLPATLGRTSRRFATPHRAALAVGLVIAGGTVLQAWAGRDSLLDATIGVATSIGFVVGYLLVCAAAVPYLARLGEMSAREIWPAALGTLALATIAVTEVVGTGGDGRTGLILLAAILGMVVAAHYARLRTGGLSAARAGAYDTPVASDALAPLDEGSRGR